jgi:L-alanine-DL-glutamate epimerase-like enolase superfamily enzyme
MRIADVRIRVLEAPITDAISLSFGALQVRRMGLVEIESDSGSIGYGESWLNFPPWAWRERKATVDQGIAPLLRGEQLDSVHRLVSLLHSRLDGYGRQWGAKGPIYQAISGIEIALWDLLGKERHASLHELLGGSLRSRIPLYASGLEPSNVVDLSTRCVAEGFSGIKLRVGFGDQTDLASVDQASAVLRDSGQLYLDANQAWSLEQAIHLLQRLAIGQIAWVEEPVCGNAVDELGRLYEKTGVPVAVGENFYGLAEFMPYMRSDAVAVLQPDVSKVGGIIEMSRICLKADAYHKVVTPHWYGGAIALAATLHTAAVHPTVDQVEFDVRTNPFRDSLVTPRLDAVEGTIRVPDGPGLGVEPDPAAIQEYEVDDV